MEKKCPIIFISCKPNRIKKIQNTPSSKPPKKLNIILNKIKIEGKAYVK